MRAGEVHTSSPLAFSAHLSRSPGLSKQNQSRTLVFFPHSINFQAFMQQTE